MMRFFMRFFCVLLASFVATACVSTRDRHGYVIERGETELEALAGIDTKESVLARYGEPSTRAVLTDDVWYYMSSASNTRAFYRTEIMRREVIAFSFDEEGIVKTVDRYTLADGKDVNMVNRVTRTRGKELTVLEQLIGGVGQLPGAVDPDDLRP
ncbi:MAG: outer membrane protein assembly factor BamE [Pseudomonadota bacterium]